VRNICLRVKFSGRRPGIRSAGLKCAMIAGTPLRNGFGSWSLPGSCRVRRQPFLPRHPKTPSRPMRSVGPHKYSDSVKRLPLSVKRQDLCDVEIAGSDIESFGYFRPLFEIPKRGPARNTVVDNEEIATFRSSFIDRAPRAEAATA